MKLIPKRDLKLNQLKIVLKDTDNEVIGTFYPHFDDGSLNRIVRGKNLSKIYIEGTISRKNIGDIRKFFQTLDWSLKENEE